MPSRRGGVGGAEKGSGTVDLRAGSEGIAAAAAAAGVPVGHPYDFHVCGPRNISSPNWRDIIWSSWREPNYKRTVIACLIQAAYLLELDRQEKRTKENALAPKWWKPFGYKLTQTLVDERDGSIYGAILEWDRAAALSDLMPVRPSGVPRAALALRGTLLKSLTIRRDIEDDLRFLAWESLKGSVRFNGALKVLTSVVQRFGSDNVCIGGHSLGAGFALQIGKALAKEGLFVECHLFNPPSVSLAMSLRSIGEKASSLLKRIRGVTLSSPVLVIADEGGKDCGHTEIKKWVPHLYVNNSDYFCCYYTASVGTDKSRVDSKQGAMSAKLFVASKGPKKFLEAHGLQQWWSDDIDLQLALNDSKLINRQLTSLYAAVPASPTALATAPIK